MINELDKFPKLRSVFIHTTIISDYMQYQDFAKYITPIIENNSASSLQNLCITSTANDPYFFHLYTKGEETLLPMVELKNLNVYINSKTCITTINEDLMLFIMTQCPNLKSLHVVKSGEYSQYETISNYPSLFQFMIYLSKMPNFVFRNYFI
jgi:hypothetical protein